MKHEERNLQEKCLFHTDMLAAVNFNNVTQDILVSLLSRKVNLK